jgi:sugar lactone lactonase YvrE
MMNHTSVRCLAATQDVCGEGCVWHPQLNAVFWTDINRGLLHCYSLESEALETWRFDQPVTAVVLTTREDQIVLVFGGRIVVWDTRSQKVVDVLFRLAEWPAVRCNDARVDPAGVLWFGTMQNNVRSDGVTTEVTEWRGALYSLTPGSDARVWYSGFGITNTLAWSPGGETMYFGDTLQNCLYRGAFDPVSSRVENREIFFEGFARGLPDGSAVDAKGYLWNCRYGGACIVRVAPDGSIASVIETPVMNPTTCAFGATGSDTLFFTSAAASQGTQQPEAGSLFSFQPEEQGLLSTPLRL